MDIRDRKEQLATDILKLTRLRLQMKLPVMSGALLLPEWKYRNDGKSTGTDGICLYWNPEEVLRWFHDAPIQVERRYLHLVLHCLYLHPLREPAAEKTIWNLACDLMEPFRPLVDLKVKKMAFPFFEKEEKHEMVSLLKEEVIIGNRNEYLTNAIKIYTRSVFDALNDNDVSQIKFYRTNEL